jgi:hypothetical protein
VAPQKKYIHLQYMTRTTNHRNSIASGKNRNEVKKSPIKRGEIGEKLQQARITLACGKPQGILQHQRKKKYRSKTGRQKSLPFSSI